MLKTYMNPLYSDIKKYTYNKLLVNSYTYEGDFQLIFFHLRFSNLSETDIVDKLLLNLVVPKVGTVLPTFDLYLFKENDISAANQLSIYNRINDGLENYSNEIECEELESDNSYGVLSINLNKMNLNLKDSNSECIIVVKPSVNYTSENFELLIGNTFFCVAKVFDIECMTQASKINTYEYDSNTKVMVDEFDGNVITNINLFSTLNKKTPINLSIIGNNNKTPDISYLPLNMMMSYQYEWETEYIGSTVSAYIIKNSTGAKQRFFRVDSVNEGDFGKYFNHNVSSYNMKLYNEENGSCMYIDAQYAQQIYIYNKDRTCSTFSMPTSSYPLRLLSIETKEGKGIYYTWNGKYLQSISTSSSNSNVKDVTFTYDSLNRINLIDYPKLKLKVRFILTSYQVQIKYIRYDNDDNIEEELKTVSLYYVGDKLDTISNSMNNEQMILVYDGYNRLEEIKFYKNNTSMSSNTYEYFTLSRKVTNHLGESRITYFDLCKRCISEVDNYGNISSNEYIEGTNYIYNKSNIKTNNSLIENNSFEVVFNNSLPGWTVDLQGSSLYSEKGMFGKCLKVDRMPGSNNTVISQTLTDYTGKLNSLSMWVKHDSYYYNNLEIKVVGSYVLNGTTSSFTRTMPSLTTTGWEELKITSFGVPEGATKVVATISIIINPVYSCEIYFDEVTTNLDKSRTVNYNYISNGNMNKMNSTNIPSNWIFSSRLSNEKVTALSGVNEAFNCFDVLKLIGNTEERKVYQVVKKSGVPGDTFSFTMLYKLLGNMSLFTAYIDLYDENNEIAESITIDQNRVNNAWQIMSKTFTTSISFTKMEVGIKYKGASSVYIDEVQLIKVNSTNYYSYNEKGNISEIASNNGKTSHIIYDEFDRIDLMVTADGTSYKIKYNDDNTIDYIQDSKGSKISYLYDDYKFVKQTTLTYGSETITTSQTNDTDGYLLSETNEFGKTFINELDTLKNVLKETCPNGGIFDYTYTKYSELDTLTSGTNKHSLTYEEENRNIKEIEVQGGSKYKFEYDDFGNLLNVKLNNVLLTSFTYETTNGFNLGLVKTKSYLDNIQYTFSYDKKQRLEHILYDGDPIVEFKYDDIDNVCKVIDNVNSLTKYFTYENDKLVRITTSKGDDYNYFYDNLGNIQKTNYKINGKNRSVEFMHNYENNESTFDHYINCLIKNGVDVIVGGREFTGLYGLEKTSSTISSTIFYDNYVPIYKFEDELDFVTIDLDSCNKKLKEGVNARQDFNYEDWKEKYDKHKNIAIWFKPIGTYKETTLIKLESKNNTSVFAEFRISDTGYIECFNRNGTLIFSSSLKVNADKWNLLIVSIDEWVMSLYLNGFYISHTLNNITYEVDTLHIGKQNVIRSINDEESSSSSSSSEESTSMAFNLSLIAVGNFKDLNPYLFRDGMYALSSSQTTSYQGTYYSKTSLNNDYEILTLNGSLESNKGSVPLFFTKDKDKSIFRLDESKSQLALAAFKSNVFGFKEIGYDLDLTTSGMISIDFKSETASSSLTKEILNLYHGTLNSTEFKFYIKSGKLYVSSRIGTRSFSGVTINNDTWYKLTVFYTSTSATIYINTTPLGTINYTYSNLFSACTLYLGGKANIDKLDGLLSNLVISKTSISSSNYVSVINTLTNELKVKHIDKYDGLNRLTSKELHTGTQTLEHTFTYEKNRVKSENIFGDRLLNYTYDEMGNIKTITDSYDSSNNKSYSFDKYGRLYSEFIKEENAIRSYEYDSSGNILSIIDENQDREVVRSLSYHYTNDKLDYIKDELTNTNLFTLEYDGHNPTKINDNDITYEGRRIKTYGSNEYFYNEEGIRVKKKTSTGKTHEYTLEGTKIISEKVYTTSNNSLVAQLDYNYDANGQLISVEYNNNIYFYIKDILGNIIKIIDKNNRDIVKYKYNSWGVVTRTICVTTSDASYLLAYYNPFVFKSYYYDPETRLYYLNSRFYSPELCRFITIDDHSYLNPESLGSISLYCYCGNNPIMLYDEMGNMPKWLKTGLVVFAGIAVIASVAAITVLTGGTATPVLVGAALGALNSGVSSAIVQISCNKSLDINKLLVDITFGGVMGAFGGSTLSQVGMTIAGGATGAASSMVEDWIQGEEIDLVKALGNGFLGAMFAFNSGAAKQFSTKSNSAPIRTTLKNISQREGKWKKGLMTINKNKLKRISKEVIADISSGTMADFANNFIQQILSLRL